MEINGIKVPETIEELNALGVYAKAVADNLNAALDSIEKARGQEDADDWLDVYSDFYRSDIEAAYLKGLENLLEKAVTDFTDKLTIGKVRGLGVDHCIQHKLEAIGKNLYYKFDWFHGKGGVEADEET